MKKVLISYCNERYKSSQYILEKSAHEIGKVEKVISYNDTWIKSTDFYKKNKFILDQSRGAGYWIWKPYIILETLKNLDKDDIVIYCDAGVEVIEPLSYLTNLLNEKNMKIFFSNDFHINKIWTKRDTFVIMNCDEKKYWDGTQINGGYHIWKNTEDNISFLNEYQKYLLDPRIVTDCINMCGANFLEFKDHRHDQSVLSLMCIKYNLEIFRDPCQFGNKYIDNFSNSIYPQIFNHHRGDLRTLKFKQLYV